MVDTDDTQRTTDGERRTTDAGQRHGYGISSPQVSEKDSGGYLEELQPKLTIFHVKIVVKLQQHYVNLHQMGCMLLQPIWGGG